METKEMIIIMQAYVNGEQIEYKSLLGRWIPVENPEWDWAHVEYRIKPNNWRAMKNCQYYYVDMVSCQYSVVAALEQFSIADDCHYKSNNYFRLKHDAQQVADKFNLILEESV